MITRFLVIPGVESLMTNLILRHSRWKKTSFSLASLLAGLMAAGSLAFVSREERGELWLGLFVIFALISVICDVCDGLVAKIHQRASIPGAALDSLVDNLVIVSIGAGFAFQVQANGLGSPLTVSMLFLGFGGWVSAPLSTIAFRALGTQSRSGKTIQAASQLPAWLLRLTKFILGLADWSLVLVGCFLASCYPTDSSVTFFAVYVFVTGILQSLGRIFAFARLDNWQ